MLRAKFFKGFAILVIIFGALSAFFVIRMIETRVFEEARRRVQLDLNSAWAVYNSNMREIETILKLAATKESVVAVAEKKDWKNSYICHRLDVIRRTLKLDFLGIVQPEGQIVLRSTSPYKPEDTIATTNPLIQMALQGKSVCGNFVLNKMELERESEDLAERAFLNLEDTPKARPRTKSTESRGLVMMGAIPIMRNTQILGVVYGGMLLNRNYDLIDRIQHTLYKKEMYENSPIGTATIFLYDARVTTTVKLPNGNRALGTRVSKEVADRVLDGNGSWMDKAFVVNDWYLTAYDPIYDLEGKIIGMFYVGLLEKPFRDLGNSIIKRYIWVLGVSFLFSLVLAYIFAERLVMPIKRLDEAIHKMRVGEKPAPLPLDGVSQEIGSLTDAFNQMANTLYEREANLKEANEKMEAANASLKATNRSYMETLGFVSHELKSPVSTIMNYVYLIKEQKVGPLTEKQDKAVKNIHSNLTRVVEMIRHYLNLSRIENGVLEPVKTKVAVLEDVIKPIIENVEPDLQNRKMILTNRISEEIPLYSDLNMSREVFENLISNAVKYGRDGGKIAISCERKNGFVEFSVGNEGEGIPSDKLESVFQKFSRLEEQQSTRRQKGTGLGLFITKHIVEAHGGKIEVVSKPNEWTEFRFTLPAFNEKENC